jgi:ribosomal protein S5
VGVATGGGAGAKARRQGLSGGREREETARAWRGNGVFSTHHRPHPFPFHPQVGVGTASAKEVIEAVQKAVIDAKKNLVTVPLTRGYSFPHRTEGVFGAARVMLRPASEGTGVIAGGAVRVVLELAGVKNAFGKQLGSGNPLNNARATIVGLKSQRTPEDVAKERGLSVAELLTFKPA